MHGGSLEITLTVPLMNPDKVDFNMILYIFTCCIIIKQFPDVVNIKVWLRSGVV